MRDLIPSCHNRKFREMNNKISQKKLKNINNFSKIDL